MQHTETFASPRDNHASQRSAQERANEVLSVLARSAEQEYIGEPISQLEHALQAAASARKAKASNEVILAALLHDIGHLIDVDAPQMDGLGTLDHEELGAHYLGQMGCSATVTELVRSHVQAKRYLCGRNPQYHARLSEASRGTLEWQGGRMSSEEAAHFEASPLFRTILALRSWDEQAKRTDIEVEPLSSYHGLLVAHLEHEEERRNETTTQPPRGSHHV